MGRRRKKKLPKLKIRTETLHSVVAIGLIAMGVLVIISFSGQGRLLMAIHTWLRDYLGLSVLFLPFVFIASGMIMFRTKWRWSKPSILLGTLLIMFGTLGLFRTGQVGQNTYTNLQQLVTDLGAIVVFLSIALTGVMIISDYSVGEIFEWVGGLFKKDKKALDLDLDENVEGKSRGMWLPKLSLPFKKDKGFDINSADNEFVDDNDGTAVIPLKPEPVAEGGEEIRPGSMTNKERLIWEYPPLSLLKESDGGKADRGDVNQNAATIEHTLESFGISARVAEVNYGPSVTQYALEITRKGTKLSKITGLSTDLALALAAPTGQIRIEAPIPGRSLVGVEVPNHSAEYVTLRKMLSSPLMKKHPSKLAMSLGINVAGQPVVMDLTRMPHVLIAGSTGSGKSVAINSFMCSVLFRASPAEVKFILVDPKRVELTGYNDIPHLLVPVIVDPKKVVSALKWATNEMDERYKLLAAAGVKNIQGYNELAGIAAMPHIVIVIDELADIMLFAPAEVEESITRIAQMARAVGIHLLLATQRPSVDVLTGLIKANIPARIAFNVSSMTDSRVILDTPGAEKLLGRGDMLFLSPEQAKPSRIQGTFVSDQEITELITFIKDQGQQPNYEEEITTKYKVKADGAGAVATTDEERDALFLESAQFVAAEGKGSSSMIQRRFSVGYNRAARILDQLHAAGMVGPPDGSKPREVYTSRVMEYLRSMESHDQE